MKIYSACRAIRRTSIICFCVEGPSHFNQSCLNLGLLFFFFSRVVWKFLSKLLLPILALKLHKIGTWQFQKTFCLYPSAQANGWRRRVGSLAVGAHGLSSVWYWPYGDNMGDKDLRVSLRKLQNVFFNMISFRLVACSYGRWVPVNSLFADICEMLLSRRHHWLRVLSV